MVAAHSDSPSFKIKEKAEMTAENLYVRLNVEKYGGMILSTWLDRCRTCFSGKGWGSGDEACQCGQGFAGYSQCGNSHEP